MTHFATKLWVLPSLKASRLGGVSLITILHIKLCLINNLFSQSILVNISKYDVILVLQLPIHYSEPYKQSNWGSVYKWTENNTKNTHRNIVTDSSSSRRWTFFNCCKFWPSQRPPSSISLDPGHKLSNFWSSFGKCPVWCYPPICTWVFLVIFWSEVSN